MSSKLSRDVLDVALTDMAALASTTVFHTLRSLA